MSACHRCGAEEIGEEFCLACGTRLRAPARTGDRGRSLAVLAGVLVLAALGALLAIVVSRTTTETTLVATNLPARTTVRLAPVLGTLTVPVTTTPPIVTATTPSSLPGAQTLTPWTLADGYTVVLASVARASGRPTAVQIAKHALTQGLPQVGLIDTQGYTGLAPGFFVVFSGIYSSEADASALLAQAKAAGFSAAYARHVTR